jgi:2-dehydro-3-deoxyphosphogluconate aldolase/(4S)-4-hydroxy-2-oxoglutarate aldolase
MRDKAEILRLLMDTGIVAVVRAERTEQVLPLAHALLAGGILAIEITMTTPGALGAIRQASAELGSSALIGVGTVLDARTCRESLEAGAEFVVTPICRTELVSLAHAAQKPIMIGAYTPTEAQAAHDAGADFVKLFPAENLGARYIRSLRAPLPHLRIVPTGGLEVANVGEFFKAGCAALGVGSSLISSQILNDSDWPAVTSRAKEFVLAARQARSPAA